MTMPDAAILPANPGNYASRRNTPVDLVVIHTTEAPYHSACVWFADPRAKASAHYVVSRAGLVAQCVPEAMEAFHAGNAAVNRRSIGVELEAWCDDAATLVAGSTLLETAAALVAGICGRHGIPIDREHVVGHSEVADPAHPSEEWVHGGAHHHRDPGPHFPWDDFMSRVRALRSPRSAA